jgi:phospholipid/cholesterol/gamma-HCH transport system substrate-binding protein
MIGKRTLINLGVFLGLAALLVYLGASRLVFTEGGGQTVNMDFADASGLAPRNDVTMRGVPVGTVTSVELTSKGLAHVTVLLQPDTTVPQGSKADITRRSPIGDLTIELTPGSGPPIPNDGSIPLSDTGIPPEPEKTIEELARVLHSVPSEDLTIVVSELAAALRGRGRDLATLSEAGADLPERILKVQAELRSLIENGPKVTGVLADNATALADDFRQTALLADILRDRRFDLVRLSENGADFATVANNLIAGEKANLACLIADFGSVNATLAEGQHLKDLQTTLELNHFFFDAVEISVQPGKDGIDWFRVQNLPPQQPHGRMYEPMRPPPDVFQGNSCSSIYGKGVGPPSQPGPVWLASGSRLHHGR